MGNKEKILLGLILLVAGVLRFYQLDKAPPSLSWDEVAIGYNAYSILKTGKDEYGNIIPVLFRSFDDYKLPGMVYSVALSEAVFGLNEWGVRVPSSLFGFLAVVVGFFLGKKLINKYFGLIFAGLLATNPWLINFSRQAFESNGAMFFTFFGMYLLFLSLKKKEYLIAASISFVFSLYFYYSARILIPFLLAGFFLSYKNFVGENIKFLIISAVLSFILLLPLLQQMFTSGGLTRISQVVFTNDLDYIKRQNIYSSKILKYKNRLWARLVYNRRRAMIETIFINYFKNLNPLYIFRSGTISAGLLYIWEFPFVLLGIFQLLKQKRKWKWIFLICLLAYPLIGALTRNQPNPLRTLIGSPFLIFTSGMGLYMFLLFFKDKKIRYYMSIGTSLLIIVSALWFFPRYIKLLKERALDFGDGYKQMARYVSKNEAKYDTIWISGDYWRPYIHLLFHLKYPPDKYQKSGSRVGFGKYKFGKADWDKDGIDLGSVDLVELKKGKTLIVFSKDEFEKQKSYKNLIKKQIIDGRDAKKVFYAVSI